MITPTPVEIAHHRPVRTPGAVPVAADKRFPTPLLKCPKAVFTAFTAKYRLSSSLIEAVSAARLRKANRKFQRMTRNRRAKHPSKHVNPESDDEGDCATIDDVAVHAQLMAVYEPGPSHEAHADY